MIHTSWLCSRGLSMQADRQAGRPVKVGKRKCAIMDWDLRMLMCLLLYLARYVLFLGNVVYFYLCAQHLSCVFLIRLKVYVFTTSIHSTCMNQAFSGVWIIRTTTLEYARALNILLRTSARARRLAMNSSEMCAYARARTYLSVASDHRSLWHHSYKFCCQLILIS